jgi:N-acetylneuraminic acid mutarotase
VRLLAVAVALVAAQAAPAGASAAPAPVRAGADDDRPGRWVERPPLNVPRFGLDVATARGQIFAVGGFADDRFLDTVETRRVGGRGVWRTVDPISPARGNLATAALDGIVYAIGGIADGDISVDIVETFDPRQGSWRAGPTLPQPRDSAGAAALGGKLYVAGGVVGAPGVGETTASVIVYDPAKRTWREVAPMPTAREKLRLVAAGPHLYAIGGFDADLDSVATVERYDPGTDRWQTLPSMHETRAVPGATTTRVGNRRVVVVVGGAQGRLGGGTTALRSTEVFDPRTGGWRVLRAQLPTGRGSLGAATEADGDVLAIGGGPTRTTPEAETLALRITRRDLAG